MAEYIRIVEYWHTIHAAHFFPLVSYLCDHNFPRGCPLKSVIAVAAAVAAAFLLLLFVHSIVRAYCEKQWKRRTAPHGKIIVENVITNSEYGFTATEIGWLFFVWSILHAPSTQSCHLIFIGSVCLFGGVCANTYIRTFITLHQINQTIPSLVLQNVPLSISIYQNNWIECIKASKTYLLDWVDSLGLCLFI